MIRKSLLLMGIRMRLWGSSRLISHERFVFTSVKSTTLFKSRIIWSHFFYKSNQSHVMQLEKELISLNPHSFNTIEDYLAHVKELKLKLGECGKNYWKKYGKLIEIVLMNLRTPFDLLISNFHTNWQVCKEDCKDYMFESFYVLLIIDQHKLLNEGKIIGKHQAYFLKGKGKSNHKERGMFDTSIERHGSIEQKTKGTIDAHYQIWKKKTCQYCGNIGHVNKVCCKKWDDIEEIVKFLEWDMFNVIWLINNFTFHVRNSQTMLFHCR